MQYNKKTPACNHCRPVFQFLLVYSHLYQKEFKKIYATMKTKRYEYFFFLL